MWASHKRIDKTFSAFFAVEPKPRCATTLSKYGCCWDQKTEAKSFNGEGCPGKKVDYAYWFLFSRGKVEQPTTYKFPARVVFSELIYIGFTLLV